MITPVQVSHPPLCGPPAASSARFQAIADLAQLRVVPMVMLRAWKVSVSRKNFSGGSAAPCDPEHSVNQIPLRGKAACSALIASGLPE